MEDKEKHNDGLGVLGWDMLLCGLIGLIGIIAEKCHDHYYDKYYDRNETKDIIIEEDTLHCEEHKHNNDTSYDICEYYKDISKIDKN